MGGSNMKGFPPVKYQARLKKACGNEARCSVNTCVMLPMAHHQIHQHRPMHKHSTSHNIHTRTHSPSLLWECTNRSNKTKIPTYAAALHYRVRKQSVQWREEAVELINSRIHQRWDSQQRHKSNSQIWRLSLWLALIKTSKWVNNIIWTGNAFWVERQTIIYYLLVSTPLSELNRPLSSAVDVEFDSHCRWASFQNKIITENLIPI